MNIKFPARFKPNRTWVMLGIAIGVGLLAALAARNYLSNRIAAIESRGREGLVNLVVAKAALKKGDILSPETVAVRQVPRDFAHSNALRPADFDRVEGQQVAAEAQPGELILWSMVERKKPPTFSARVESGRRAITVPVDEINSISGMLEPGDLIDLIVTLEQKGKKKTFSLMQGVRVMATGQRAADDPKSGERRLYSTVTLDTTPQQAQNLIVARDSGKITALLRNPQEKQLHAGGGSDISALLGLAADSEEAQAERQIPVLYGGRSTKLAPEALTLSGFERPEARR